MKHTENLVPALTMPEWLREIEAAAEPFPGDEAKVAFAIRLATENVRRGTGGPFGAAIFDLATDRLVAAAVNRVTPSGLSWAHAEMIAITRAQYRCGVLTLAGCLLASSCEPCAMCYGATPWSGVERLLFGAAGDAAQRIGFDEGDKAPDWREALEKRGIRVAGPLCGDAAETPFRLYRERAGVIY